MEPAGRAVRTAARGALLDPVTGVRSQRRRRRGGRAPARRPSFQPVDRHPGSSTVISVVRPPYPPGTTVEQTGWWSRSWNDGRATGMTVDSARPSPRNTGPWVQDVRPPPRKAPNPGPGVGARLSDACAWRRRGFQAGVRVPDRAVRATHDHVMHITPARQLRFPDKEPRNPANPINRPSLLWRLRKPEMCTEPRCAHFEVYRVLQNDH